MTAYPDLFTPYPLEGANPWGAPTMDDGRLVLHTRPGRPALTDDWQAIDTDAGRMWARRTACSDDPAFAVCLCAAEVRPLPVALVPEHP